MAFAGWIRYETDHASHQIVPKLYQAGSSIKVDKDVTIVYAKWLNPVTITAENKTAAYSADGIIIPVEGMFTITGSTNTAVYTVANGTGTGTFDTQTGKLTVTKCGTFTVSVSIAATDAHAPASASATLTVNKADLSQLLQVV